jgi:hypothetical protein
MPGRRQGDYALLELAWPGRPIRNIGVALLDPGTDRLWLRFTRHWDEGTDREYLGALQEEMEQRSRESGGKALLRWCEDTLSNILRITPRESLPVDSFNRVLGSLFDRHVERQVVEPFRTHLPLYSLRAAAGKFGHEQAVEEEDWIAVPDLRLDERMFVAHVVGRSMEPRIPDGSLNVFEAGVVGSRQDKIVLAELLGTTDATARYTVKKYSSAKRASGDDEWEHASVTLLPVNREFDPIAVAPGECLIVAEWKRTLE